MYMQLIKDWKEIPGFPGYRISEYGDVWSDKRNQEIAKGRNWAGYLTVTITDENGFRSPRKIHRLVYLAYVGPFEAGKIIDHIDDKKHNNYYKNLQQITQPQNSSKSFITGKNKSKVVWTKDIIHDICEYLSLGWTNKEIFKSLGINYKMERDKCNHLIGDLLNGRQHKDITINYDFSNRISCLNKKDIKLTPNAVVDIYTKLQKKEVLAFQLAKQYNVSWSTICKIRDKKTWRVITDKIDNILISQVPCSTTIPSG